MQPNQTNQNKINGNKHNTIQYNTIQYITLQYNIQYNITNTIIQIEKKTNETERNH